MTAPTLLDFGESNWTDTSLTETTADIDWSAAGDFVIVLGATEDNAQTIGTPTATGLTFAAMSGTPTNSSNSCKAYAWSATAAGNNNSTVTATGAGGTATRGISAWAFTGSAALGSPVVAVSAALTVSVGVQQDSTVIMVLADWNAAVASAPVTTPAGGTVVRNTNVNGAATYVLVEWTNQAAGTRSYGIGSGWTGTGTVSKIAVEVQGTASAGVELPTLVVPRGWRH